MKKVLMGNHAASWAVQLSRVQVISAYPITPQTHVVEELSEMCADGRLDAKFLKVESEHSAMAAVVASSSTGVRSFTASSSNGLALMHEMLHWAAGARLPIVMVNVNRAMAPGWNIWCDQTDSLSQRDTGWIQIYVEDNQEVLDTVVQAYRIAEDVLLPVMVCYDAFFLSHTYEPVDIPDAAQIDRYLPEARHRMVLDTRDPHAFNALVTPDVYMEMRWQIHEAHRRALGVVEQAGQEYNELLGRSYGRVEAVDCEDADLVIVTSSSTTSPARLVARKLRREGKKVGLLKIRLFRPFPVDDVRRVLANAKKAVVIDRNISFGKGGIFADELRGALLNAPTRPAVFGFVAGLGGRDITPELIEEMVIEAMGRDQPADDVVFKGLMPA
ncbi:MAG: pyruvate ferredoxin oxidoreductase [Deltaproteobacteria bacterium]|nr:pyruvate ferredoxin oxidoreductase [Deltaproteobacteria bacterium]